MGFPPKSVTPLRYNRDGDDLPQINFGILYGTSSSLPLFYKVYPGSISDVSTFTNICKELVSVGMENFTFCLDRGFYSAKNLAQVHGEQFDIMIPMPFSTKEASRLSVIDIATPENLRDVNGYAVFGKTFDIEIASHKFYATVFQTEKRRTRELDEFAAALHKYDQIAIEALSEDSTAIEGIKKTFPSMIAKCYDIHNSDGVYSLKRQDDEVRNAMARMGKMIILTKSQPACIASLLSGYRARDAIEKSFDLMKNELNEGRLRVVGSDAIEGRIFVNFIALIIVSYLRNSLASNNLATKFTLSEALCELNKVKRVTLYDGSTCLTEISKKQRDLFDAFGVACPKL
jgi:transposase